MKGNPMKYNENVQKNARTFLLAQLAEGKTDSGLAQRFHVWVQKQSGSDLNPIATLRLFLEACQAEKIKARDIDGYFVYGVYPEGIDPQPYNPWEPDEKPPQSPQDARTGTDAGQKP